MENENKDWEDIEIKIGDKTINPTPIEYPIKPPPVAAPPPNNINTMTDASKFDNELFEKILEDIATSTDGLRTICERNKIDYSTFKKWLRRDPDLKARYTRAKEEQMEEYAENIREIANESVPKDAFGKQDMAAVQDKKLRIDTEKWIMSKLAPATFGDNKNLDIKIEEKRPMTAEQFGQFLGKIEEVAVKLIPAPIPIKEEDTDDESEYTEFQDISNG